MGRTLHIATRGSALALAQANMVLAQVRTRFPDRKFELKIIKTTGDKLQTANLSAPGQESTKGLFTKELEVALLNGEADFAVHSLKDLPTELPEGLHLAAASEREDARDVFIYRGPELAGAGRSYPEGARVQSLPPGATIATSSTRRQAQLTTLNPSLRTVPIRGNVGTRLQKLRDNTELDGIVLAMAGLKRLGFQVDAGRLTGKDIPAGFLADVLPVEEMIPCVGQAALGIEARVDDPLIMEICRSLNHHPTELSVRAERAFLHAMGGGCLSPVAAFAAIEGAELRIRAVSFRTSECRTAELRGPAQLPERLGVEAAAVVQS